MAREPAKDVADRYQRAKELRSPRDTQYRLNAAYCLPRDYENWMSDAGNENSTGGVDNDFRSRFAFDSTGVRAIPKYKAICKRLINPDGVRYHRIAANNQDLMRIPAVRKYFTEVTDLIFNMRQSPSARFGTAQSELYGSYGVYGNGIKSTLWRKPMARFDRGGFIYRAWPMYNMWWLVDDMGNITDVFRRFYVTRRQFELWKPDAPMPLAIKNILPTDIKSKVEFVHAVSYRKSGYDPKALDARRHPWQSCYVCVPDAEYVGDEEGFINNPYQISAIDTVAGDAYGIAPAEIAFPALGGANATKKTYLKQGHKAVDPTLLANDDGALSGRIDARPSRIIYGGIDSQGRDMVKALQLGSNFQVAEQLLADDRNDINDSFLVTLFQILTDTPEMTAAEVYERIAEKAALYAPTMAAIQETDQGPQVEREVALLAENNRLPQMPPELVEARGEYKVEYINPMQKAMYAGEVSGFMRWQDMLTQAAANTQDPSPMDHVNWDEAAPEIADKMDVRPHWVSTPEQVKAKRDARAQAQQQQAMIDAAPAAASVMSTMAKGGAQR
jgi:hypothetical protein